MKSEYITFGDKKIDRFFPNININRDPGSLWSFYEYKCPKLPEFLEYITSNSVLPIVDFAYNIHKNDQRKVTKAPYFKHLMYSAYLCWERIEESGNRYSQNEKQVLIGASLLHDSIELRNKTAVYDEKMLYEEMVQYLKPKNNSEFEQIKKIFLICSNSELFFGFKY